MSSLNDLLMRPTWFNLRFKTMAVLTFMLTVANAVYSINFYDQIAEGIPLTKVAKTNDFFESFRCRG